MTADGLADTPYLLDGVNPGLNNALNGNIVYGIINPSDMSLMSANVIESSKGSGTTHVTQFKNLQLIGDRLVMSTALNGAFIQGDKTLASSYAAKLEGATLTVNLNTLNAERGYCTGQNIGADFLAIIDESANTLYSVGYVMATGTHLHAYNLTSGEYKGSTPLTSKISSISSAAFNSDSKELLTACYAKDLGTICGTAEAPVYSSLSLIHI